MTDRPLWTSAGRRATPAEAQNIRNRRRQQALQAATIHDRATKQAHVLWAAGKVVPWRITQALNAGGHEGPEVDAACGVLEPAVDEWESGDRYPTWEQLEALTRLTGYGVAWFTRPVDADLLAASTGGSLRYHFPPSAFSNEPPVLRYTTAALAASGLDVYGVTTLERPRT